MASQGHPRAGGGTPSRADRMRRRVEPAANPELVESLDMSDDESLASCDSDAGWHAHQGMPCVSIGSFFELVGGEGESTYKYERTAKREASCESCGRAFNRNSYHKRALLDHGAAFAKT